MKTTLVAVAICCTIYCRSYAQQTGPATGGTSACITNVDQVAYYATLNQRVLELTTQSDLLKHLAIEHKQRAQETVPGQEAKRQWEDDLAKDFANRAATTGALLAAASQEQIAFERAHLDLLALKGLPLTGSPNADALAFIDRLEERLATVQQEIAQTLETGKLYSSQLLTNNSPQHISEMTSLLQANGDAMKRLQREAFDLELRKLEFRALRRD